MDDVVEGPGSVGVPAAMIQLHESHAALDEAARHEAVVGEGGLPGSAPYIARIDSGSCERSVSSGTLDCIR